MTYIQPLLRRRMGRLAWATVLLTLALFIAGNALKGATPIGNLPKALLPFDNGWWIRLSPLYAIVFSIVGALIISRRPGNRIGWVAVLIGLLTAVYTFGLGYLVFGTYGHPGALPAVPFVSWIENWEWSLPVVLMLFFLPLLFPDGQPISSRWWLVAVVEVVGFTSALAGLVGPGQLVSVACALLANVSLAIRYRRAGRDERQQITWFALAALVLGIVAVAGVVVGSAVYHNNTVVFNPIFDVLIPLALTGLALSIGIAVLRYRLYDIDVFIRQALVYGTLVVLISIAYFIGAVSVGSRLGNFRNNDPAAPVAIGVVVAIAFMPMRRRLQRLANRLVYGKRATPYEVLSRFSQRVSEMYATEELPVRMAQVLKEGTSADRATVWLRLGGDLRRAATWPAAEASTTSLPLESDELPAIPGAAEAAPVRYQGELLGVLSVEKREPMTATESRLLADLAQEAGLVLKNARLTAELLERLDELQASRQRLVTAQDTERRRLERNLHDGAQQDLVALKLKIALAQRMATTDPERTQAMLAELTGQVTTAIETLRELARGLYPPILAERGLGAALEAQARRAPLPVEILGGDGHRYPQEIEAAAYFCCLEALQNVAKHAHASRATVRLGEQDGCLLFSVIDDGGGVDPARARKGSGMQNMADRLAALGGSLALQPNPDGGTIVTGRLPVQARVTSLA